MNHSRPNITDTLKKCYPFWEKLTDTQREQLKTSSYIRDYEPGSFVHSRSEECLGILIVLTGQLRTYIQSEEGREVTLFRLGPGEVCTLSAACMMQEITFDIFIESTAASTLLITGASGIHRLMEANIYAENYIYRQTAERFSDVMWSMGQLLFSSFDKRLAAYLADEYVKLGSDVISTTHEQIAKNLGTAREVVSRMLKYFEKEGLVALGRGTITIKNVSGLKKLLY